MAQVALSIVAPSGAELPLASSPWAPGTFRVMDGTAGLGLPVARASFSESAGDGRRLGNVRTSGRTINLGIGIFPDPGTPGWVKAAVQAPLYRNHLTNPSFETPGSIAEVRRNLVLNPQGTPPINGTSLAPRWAGSGGTSTTTYAVPEANLPDGVETFARKTWTTVGASVADVAWAFTSVNRIAVTAGDTYRIRYWWRTSVSSAPTASFLVMRIFDAPSGGTSLGSPQGGSFPAPGANKWQLVEGTITATHTGYADLFHNLNFGSASVVPVGSTIDATAVLVEKTDKTSGLWTGYLDGTRSPDPDLTPEWLGTPGASESRLVATVPAGLTAGNAFAIRSSAWASDGAHSLRLVSTAPGAGSAYVILRNFTAADAGKTFTAVATARVVQTFPGAENYDRSFLFSGTLGVLQGPQAPNTVGTHEVRWTFRVPDGTTAGTFRLYHGGLRGEPDLWWDNVALVEGAYDGPAFTGDTAEEPMGDTLEERTVGSLAYRWDGTPHASTATCYRQPWVMAGIRSDDELRAEVQDRVDELADAIAYVDGKPLPRLRATYPDGAAREIEFVHVGGGEGGLSSAGEGVATMLLTLDCPDAFWTDRDFAEFVVTQADDGTPFLESLPNVYLQPSDAFGSVRVTNPGKVPSWVDFELHGPLTHVEASLGADGWAYTEPVLEGETVYIRRTAAGIEVIDHLGASRYSALADVPRFFQLPPGTSTVNVRVTGTTPATRVIGRYRPRYRQVF
ncbi:minor tail protein [Microbacterium phage Zeta1847]|uniref:Minor tail protein n=1 Tax=Microbacterium phage Zeta1847 TaxID=2201444 RepID=A0A2Z4Q9Y2_9CAUD|nr:minor tail protein [Microbacterium phage Zeta1847]AWY06649.1 minor tail protein [Microbacterium phage Zeta1847]